MNKREAEQLSDLELVEKILDENQNDAFGVLYTRYAEKVRGQCWSLLRDKATVEDVMQDIFMKAMQNLHKFRKGSAFSTWLYAIAYNHCIEHLRKNKRIKFEDWEDRLELPDEVDELEVKAILDLRQERVLLLLEMLKPEDKAVLLMKYHRGMRMQEIMDILHISGVSAAKMKINRARKRLVALYREMFGD